MDRLLRRRSAVYKKCVRLSEDLKTQNLGTVTISVLKEQLKTISEYGAEYCRFFNDIIDSDNCNDEVFEDNNNDCIKFESLIKSVKELLHTELDNRGTHQTAGRIRLPELQLPEFDGTLKSWRSFRDTYKTAVHDNNQVSDIAKFSYLLGKLKGEAKSLVAQIPISATGYETAWQILLNRYNNERAIVENHLDAILNIPKHSNNLLADLKHIFEIASVNIDSLEIWEFRLDKLSEALLVRIILGRLDFNSRKEFENEIGLSEFPKWIKLKEFLQKKIRILETIGTQKKSEVSDSSRKPKTVLVSAVQPTSETPFRFVRCSICRNEHSVNSCPDFIKLSPLERFNRVKQLKLCINCLKPNHLVSQCTNITCKRCSHKHHTLLHRNQVELNKEPPAIDQNNLVASNQISTSETSVTHHTNNISSRQHILLSTALVLIQNSKGDYINCRALLDSASQTNFITTDLFEKLGLVSKGSNLVVSGLNIQKTNLTRTCSSIIRSTNTNFKMHLELSIVPVITNHLPQYKFDISNWSMPCDLDLADPNFNNPNKIDLLLGAELFFEIILKDKIQLDHFAPSLIKTKLGWIIGGKFEEEPVSLHVRKECFDDRLDKQLEQLFHNEACETSIVESPEEKHCEELFKRTTYRDSEGRYVVSLPLKYNPSCLGNSYLVASKRFSFLEKRLNRDPELKLNYNTFMEEYIQLGHMRLSNDSNDFGYFLPHHPILKPSSSTTKLRVVFDASAKTDNNKSLNNILMTGPVVQSELFDIILRFRKHKYVFTADIEKMYRQILVNPEQRYLQKILWYNSGTIQAFELQTVTYGTASAPYLATRVLKEIANANSIRFPNASNVLKNDFYIDDCLTGCDNSVQLNSIKNDLVIMLKEAGMHLRKWSSNSKFLLEKVPSSEQEPIENKHIKALGIAWNPILDSIQVLAPKITLNNKITKRIILAEFAQIFDPLGVLSPILLKGKLLLQALWQMKIGWDEDIPKHYEIDWNTFRKSILLIENCNLGRHLSPFTQQKVQLHGFSDASEKAFGACLYVRSMNSTGNYVVKLVVSKSRVAPLKRVTLPRLELNAALLLARLTKRVVRAFNYQFESIFLWVDSTIALSWIKMDPARLKTYVANRVAEIQNLTTSCIWQHVSTKNNIADLISRGCTMEDLVESQAWWNGPLFLQQSEENWPKLAERERPQEVIDEIKPEKTTLIVSINSDILNLIEKMSSLSKLVRVISYVKRFINNINKKRQPMKGYFTATEIRSNLKCLINETQKQFFMDDIQILKDKKSLPHSSKIRDLNPFIDEQGMLRVGGRLSKSSYIPYDSRHPLILPYKSNLTKLIFREEHIKNLHCSPQQLVSIMRQRYWPLRAKLLAKGICRFCLKCYKSKPSTINQIMGNLPANRITPSRPFSVIGIDFCGPFFTRNKNQRGGSNQKVYTCIFVCFVTKAIHLEVVSDLTTEAFIACLKRFIFRRGSPSVIWSDNGTNFVGANRELKQMYELINKNEQTNKIQNFCSFTEIQWKFIPPRSPNFGGLWESSVKILKTHLKRISSNITMTYEELNTLIIQIEGVMNSRPLTATSTDPDDPTPLTPAHFLIGTSINNIPEENLIDTPSNRLSRLQNINKIFQSFWKRFSLEYLHTLQQRKKWKDKRENFKEGDLVLIVDEYLPTTQWLMGKIVEVFPGSDGINRVFNIKTKNGTIKRSISKICKIPILELNS